MKLIHSAVWALFVSVILYIVYCGLADVLSQYTWIATGLVLLEGAILIVYGGRCPLTLLARRYTRPNRVNADIFLPNWLARYNMPIFTSLCVLGLLVVGYRLLQHG